MKAAFLSDLHNSAASAEKALCSLEENKPSVILFSGDAVNRINKKCDTALDFIQKASRIAPLFISLGNHELSGDFEDFPSQARGRGAVVLDNRFTRFGSLCVGGLSFIWDWESEDIKEKREKFLEDFCSFDGFKLLLSHVPAYYTEFLRDMDIDLILSGHSHGGQIGLGKRGLYAPDQGLFPKYVGDFYDNRLIVSRGLGQTAALPRFFNPYEIIYITFN